MFEFLIGLLVGLIIGGVVITVGLREIYQRNEMLQKKISAEIDALHK